MPAYPQSAVDLYTSVSQSVELAIRFIRTKLQKADNEIEVWSRCRRCSNIDLTALLRTDEIRSVTVIQDCNRVDEKKSYINLGPLCKVEFDPHCPLCTILHHILPTTSPSPQEDVYLIPARALSYLEPTINYLPYETGHKYANLLYLGQEMTHYGAKTKRLPYVHEAHNAVGIAIDKDSKEAMLIRKVNPLRFDVRLVKAWIDSCDQNHGRDCRTGHQSNFVDLDSIQLIDTKLKKVVSYTTARTASYTTTGTVDYLCLSYVWGDVKQQTVVLGSKLSDLPATIKDAMEVVRLLGKRYLWVDSICINQSNKVEKQRQINIMDLIYSASWVTILAPSGNSPNAGLPRVIANTRPNPPMQFESTLGSIMLRTAMPNLQQQLKISIWRTRAWTFQEGVCSNRALWFTPEQVYFECHTVSCCESLDESKSSYHNLSLREHEIVSRGSVCNSLIDNTLGQRFLRTPLPAVDKNLYAKHYFPVYCDMIELYSMRQMTFPSDGINACKGILQHLTRKLLENTKVTQLGNEYFWGLPQRKLTAALLWSHIGTENASRRIGFPSWSWVGWEGQVSYTSATRSHSSGDRYQNHCDTLRAWKWQDGTFEKIHDENDPDSAINPSIRTLIDRPFSEEHMMQIIFLQNIVIHLHDTQI